MTIVAVAFIAAIPGIIAGLPALLSYFGNKRDHGNVQHRLDSLESSLTSALDSTDRRMEAVESSMTIMASTLQAMHTRQEAHEAIAAFGPD